MIRHNEGRRLRSLQHFMLAGAALSAFLPAAGYAQGNSQAEMEARLKMLEQAVSDLKAELVAARSQQNQVQQQAEAQAQQMETRVAAVEARPATPTAGLPAAGLPAEGFKVGSTTFKMGGFVKAVASASRYSGGAAADGTLIEEFYLPQQIPVGDGPATHDVIGHARQTRLFFTTSTPVGGQELKSHIEFDFALATAPAGAQRATNAYNPTFRRGFFTYGNWTFGQEWTNFQNPALFPETTDFVGPTEGVIFVRQMLLQYRQPLGNGLAVSVSVENPQTEALPSNSATAAFLDLDHDRVPDFTAKLAYKDAKSELHLSGLLRVLNMRTIVGTERYSDSAIGWGFNAGGKINFGPDNLHNFMFSAVYGHGVSRYLGVGWTADAAYDATTAIPLAGGLKAVENFAGFGALKLGWTPTLRSTFMVGYQHADYPDGVIIPGLANQESWSAAGNLFWTPVKNFDVGVEYRHGQRTVVSGLNGKLDRVEMSAKYTF